MVYAGVGAVFFMGVSTFSMYHSSYDCPGHDTKSVIYIEIEYILIVCMFICVCLLVLCSSRCITGQASLIYEKYV